MAEDPGTPIPHYTRWPIVEGYAEHQSWVAGAQIPMRCASRSGRFDVEVTRVGAGRERRWSAEQVAGRDHPVPERAWSVGCNWPVSVTVPTGTDWPSGFYEVSLTAEPDPRSADTDLDPRRQRSEAFFALRPAPTAEPGDLLLVLSTNTWNAYNQWGGRCLYTGANRVSFARPLERGYLRRPAAPDEVAYDGRVADIEDPPDPEHRRLVTYQAEGAWPLLTASGGWHNWERRFVGWAERAGYRVDVATNQDLDDDPDLLDRYRLLVSVGHDEYWSWGMRDAVDRWVAAGGNWAIFSGNTAFWQVRFEDGGRTMVCHKGRARLDDPLRGIDDSRLTSMWSDPLIGRPETSTTGLSFTRGGYHRVGLAQVGGAGGYTIHRPDHWALAGTGLRAGDLLGAGSVVVGYEVDGCALAGLEPGRPPVPTGEDGTPPGLEIVATAPARLISITADRCEAPAAIWASVEPPGDLEGVAMVLHGTPEPTEEQLQRLGSGHAVMACFRSGHAGGLVFNVGSTDWAYGLDNDPAVQQVTRNVLDHLLGR